MGEREEEFARKLYKDDKGLIEAWRKSKEHLKLSRKYHLKMEEVIRWYISENEQIFAQWLRERGRKCLEILEDDTGARAEVE